MRHLYLVFITLYSLPIFGQDGTFEFDNKIVYKYAITALEEYNAHNPKSGKNLKSDYQLDNPISYGRLVTDCDGNKVRVIMVVFPQTKGQGCASVYLTYSKDNYFGMILNREYSINPAIEAIEGFKNEDFGDFLFGCGL